MPLQFFPGNQSCYSNNDCHDLTLNSYVSSYHSCHLNDTVPMQQSRCSIKPSLIINSQTLSQCQSQCSITQPQLITPHPHTSLISNIKPIYHYINHQFSLSDKGNVNYYSHPSYKSKPTDYLKPTVHIRATVSIKPIVHIKPTAHVKPTVHVKPTAYVKHTAHVKPTARVKPTVQSNSFDNTRTFQSIPLKFLPYTFCCISGVDFTHHHHFHHSVDRWIASIIPLIQLLVTSFHFEIYLSFLSV